MSVELVLDSNVELISWVLASPVVLHCLVDELLDIDNFVVGLFLVELIALPDVDLVLVKLMTGHSDLCSDTENQEGVLLQVLEVEHRGGFPPVWINIELGLHLLLLLDNVSVVLHLVDHWGSFSEVDVLDINEKVVPFSHVAVKLVSWWQWLSIEKEAPELGIFASLLDDYDFFWCFLVLLQVLDVSSCFIHVRGKISIKNIASLPDVNWKVISSVFVACLDNENTSWIKLLALVSKIQVVHGKSASNLVRVFGLMRTYQENSWVDRQCIKLVAKKSLVEPD